MKNKKKFSVKAAKYEYVAADFDALPTWASILSFLVTFVL